MNNKIKSAVALGALLTILVIGTANAYDADKANSSEHRPGMDDSACWLVNKGYAKYVGDENSGKLFIPNPYFRGRNLTKYFFFHAKDQNDFPSGINPSHFYVDMLKIDGVLREVNRTLMPVYTYLDSDPETIYDAKTDTIADGYVEYGCSDAGMSLNYATRTSKRWSQEEYRTGNYVILRGIVKSKPTEDTPVEDTPVKDTPDEDTSTEDTSTE